MKSKVILITTIIFFLTINTTYYWEGKLGFFAIPAFLVLVVIFFGLSVALVRQIYLAVKEKLVDKSRLLLIGLLIIVLALTFIKPFGLIDFDKLAGENLLIAKRESTANCMTTLKLKDDFTFRERNVCFGVIEIKGNYHLKNDTIYFDYVTVGGHGNQFYKFAVIEASKLNKDGKHFDLTRYKSLKDTVGHELWIEKNDLNRLKDKKPNR